MRQMNFTNSTEWSFWGNVEYATNDEAKKARDIKYRELCAHYSKIQVRRSVIKGQTSKYSGMGQPDGRTGDVYVVTLNHINQKPFANELAQELFGKKA